MAGQPLMDTRWDPDRAVLTTQLKGHVDVEDVLTWRVGLTEALQRLPDGTAFRLLLDIDGYEPASLEAHKKMRTVIPEVLLRHGLRPAFLDLFPEAEEPAVSADRGVVCIAFANVHHDGTKMARYDQEIATPTQRFFTSRAEAEAWLATT
jgi:hypothetical protein